MLGPSLMWGADAALVGIAAAVPRVTVDLLDAWLAGRYRDFVATALRADALGALVFRAPVDTYVQRMAWLAAWEGRLPRSLCHDPMGTTEDEGRFLAAAKEIVELPDR